MLPWAACLWEVASAFIDICSYSSSGSVKLFGSSDIISPVGYASTATVYVAGSSATTSASTYASTATIYVSGSSSPSKKVTYNSNTGTIYVSGSSSKASITSQLVQTVFGHSNSADSISITWNKATTSGNLLVVVVAAATADIGAPSGSWSWWGCYWVWMCQCWNVLSCKCRITIDNFILICRWQCRRLGLDCSRIFGCRNFIATGQSSRT